MAGRRTLVLVGVVVILIVAAVVLYMLTRGPAEEIPPEVEVTPTPATTQIVVALRAIPRGTQILSGTVGLVAWPIELAPPDALIRLEDALGRYARFTIAQGLPIVPEMIGAMGKVVAGPSDLPLQIPAGKVAIAMPVSRLSSVAYAINAGDYVDVLASFWVVDLDEEFQTRLMNNYVMAVPGEEGAVSFVPIVPGAKERNPIFGYAAIEQPSERQRPRLVAQLTVQNARVLGVGDWLAQVEPPPPSEGEEAAGAPPPETAEEAGGKLDIVTLIVDPQDALVLKFLREGGGMVDLALRSAGDSEQTFSTESVTIQYMFARFQIAEPPKLPYGIMEPPTPTPQPVQE